MRLAGSFILIVCVMASMALVAAQERRAPTSGSLGGAITREAVRLAALQQSRIPGSNWLDVRKLQAGTEIVLMATDSRQGERYVVLADESQLTVVNLTDPAIPLRVKRVLQGLASNHPEVFESTQQTGSDVRVGPDGVFIANRKVAELRQVVETIARTDSGFFLAVRYTRVQLSALA